MTQPVRRSGIRPGAAPPVGDGRPTERWLARVEVVLKPGIRDPQGHAIERALAGLGFAGVSGVRVGKLITFEVEGGRTEAERTVARLCDTLLANPVIEDFTFRILDPHAEDAS